MAKFKILFPVSNDGNIKATNVVGSITEPSDVTFVKAKTHKGTYNPVSKEWTIASLHAGESAQLELEYSIDDFESFPFVFEISFTSDQHPDSDPSNDSKQKVVEKEDVYPCPDCPPPSVSLEDTEWTEISGEIEFENKCLECDIELSVVPGTSVNVDEVSVDNTGKYVVKPGDISLPWSFEVEAECINCPYWCGEGNSFGPFGPIEVSGSSPSKSGSSFPRYEEDDLQTGNTITLPSNATDVYQIFRNGLLLKESEYSFDSDTYTVEFEEYFSIGAGIYGESVSIFYKI